MYNTRRKYPKSNFKGLHANKQKINFKTDQYLIENFPIKIVNNKFYNNFLIVVTIGEIENTFINSSSQLYKL